VAAAVAVVLIRRDLLASSIRPWLALGARILILIGIPAITFRLLSDGMNADRLYLRAGVACLGVVSGLCLLVFLGRRWGIEQMSALPLFRGGHNA
jgi:hypothetical protein